MVLELSGNYTVEIIDIVRQPELAKSMEVVAVPTLIKNFPLPVRRLVGDLSQEAKVRAALDLRPCG